MVRDDFQKLKKLMKSILLRYGELNKKTYEYCKGIRLLPSEINTIAYIAESSSTNQSDIAKKNGFTKGAVSKMVSKLERMGLLVRYKYYRGQKEIFVHLTELGVEAYEAFKIYHKDMDMKMSSYVSQLSEEQRRLIFEFLTIYLEEMNNLKDN